MADSTYNLVNMPPGNVGNSFLGTSAATAEPVFVAALLAGETYLNIHTQAARFGDSWPYPVLWWARVCRG
jgi:hypothetical protein